MAAAVPAALARGERRWLAAQQVARRALPEGLPAWRCALLLAPCCCCRPADALAHPCRPHPASQVRRRAFLQGLGLRTLWKVSSPGEAPAVDLLVDDCEAVSMRTLAVQCV